ncbi:sensor histidine kinase [Clostridium estertheticum]|uniref:sensor histidine kinase n=1 Tax=Clostridium estertheticum TaxID=238834 RepID=UPI001C7D22F7|nr:sensor histidine kinase [Clostridium estertheticum]MBX4260526.1 sensor histidine kinase [Clostridium estertheticum]WLC71331.1 sensor histidine kinase [Clostridium estertheticum]
MNLFLKYNRGYIIIYLLSLSLTIIYCNIMDFIGFGEIIYILIFNTFILVCFLTFRYYKNRQLYKLLKNGLICLNDAFLELGSSPLSENISELLKEQHNLYEAEIQKCNKVHNEHLTFINQWVHQMKTPLSVIQLQLQEYAGEEKARSIEEEVNKLNKGLDMAMHFARIDSFQNDFIVERIFLKKLVIGTINEEKKLFIKNKITPRLEIDDAIEVYSDVKWIKFVLDQLIINAVKYSKDTGKELIIKAFEKEKEILLSVIDEGIGIPRKDIKRVFDLFFTGENGRKYGESTGMGLYISKEVCVNLGHKIEITSTADKGTMVTIRFKI